MPRSSRAATKPSASQRRANKRSTSKQPECYDILESPTISASSSARGRSQQSVEITSLLSGTTLPISSRSDEFANSTLTLHERNTTKDVIQDSVPGFEALEAVNALYQNLKNSQAEMLRLHEENKNLLMQKRESELRIEKLEVELRTEKDRITRAQQAHEAETNVARTEAEDRLQTVIASLRSYGSAALQIMPLLDVLTDATEIEYNKATEELYQILREHRQQQEKTVNDYSNGAKS